MRGEKTRERARERRESDESDNAVDGSEEYFDESEHADGFAAEERSSDSEGEDGRGPEGSDFAAEEGTRRMPRSGGECRYIYLTPILQPNVPLSLKCIRLLRRYTLAPPL